MTPTKLVLFFCLLTLTLQISNTECNVDNCLSCLTDNICSACEENYQLQPHVDGLTKCINQDCPQNCASCDQQTQCVSCLQGFQLAQTGDCLTKQQKQLSKLRFLQYSNLTGNYTGNFSGNSTGNYTNCTIPGCQICGVGSCLFCKNNFQLMTSGFCRSCSISNCLACSLSDVCVSCVQDANAYRPTPNGDSCLACDTTRVGMNGCLSCNGTNSCGVCLNGFQLVSYQNLGICIKCPIRNCESCSVDPSDVTIPICTNCSIGYSISPTKTACTQCLFPCATCTASPGPNNCATCQPPLFFAQPNPNGTCIKNNIPGCKSPNAVNISLCGLCSVGFTLSTDGTKCNWNCPPSCLECTSNVTCTSCTSGFYVNSNNLCSQCQTKGCGACSSDGVTCNACVKGFYLISSECKSCPGFCRDCSSITTCNQLTEVANQVLLLIGGQSVLAVCESICDTCSNSNPAVCLECSDGFYLEDGKCLKCGGNCKTCDSANKLTCLTCYPNTFLSSVNTCVKCDSKCMTCQSADNPSNCTSCWDGFYLNGTTCAKGCPKNCFTCSNLTTCTQCLSGYTTYIRETNVVCAPCMSSCRSCAEGKPSTCLDCGSGFYLLSGTCKPCSTNCAQCTAAGCLTCSSGYFMTTEQTCGANCILPCATCSASDPTKCEGCIAGYSFDNVNRVCVEVVTCADGCVVCPMGYSLKDALCLTCSTSHCQACDPDALGTCFSCKPGYYLKDDGTCGTCSASCRTCFSATGCSTCALGFTKKQNAVAGPDGYECVKCNSPCATCSNTPDYCSTCVEGYEFSGWKCSQIFRFTVGVTLTVSLAFFQANYMTMIEALAGAMGITDINSVTVTDITEGSVNAGLRVEPTGAPGSVEATNQLNSLTSLLKSGSIAGMSVGQMSITVDGTSEAMAEVAPGTSKTNVLAIVLGICIPIGVLIIIGIVVFAIYKKQAAEKVRINDVTEDERKRMDVTNDKIRIIN